MQALSSTVHVHSTESMVRENVNEKNENKQSYSSLQISELMTTTINIFFTSS